MSRQEFNNIFEVLHSVGTHSHLSIYHNVLTGSECLSHLLEPGKHRVSFQGEQNPHTAFTLPKSRTKCVCRDPDTCRSCPVCLLCMSSVCTL